MVDVKLVEDNIQELLEMMEECPFLDKFLSDEGGVHICHNSECRKYCVASIIDGLCGNEDITDFLEEKEKENEVHS